MKLKFCTILKCFVWFLQEENEIESIQLYSISVKCVTLLLNVEVSNTCFICFRYKHKSLMFISDTEAGHLVKSTVSLSRQLPCWRAGAWWRQQSSRYTMAVKAALNSWLVITQMIGFRVELKQPGDFETFQFETVLVTRRQKYCEV